MLRIGMFLDHYPSPDGTTVAVGGLARALVRQHSHITILSHDETAYTREVQGVIEKTFVRATPSGLRLPSRDLLSYLRTNPDGFDLLILNGIFTPGLPVLQMAAHKAGIKTIVAPHDPYHDTLFLKSRRKKAVYWTLAEKRFLSGADAIQVLSPSHIEMLRRRDVMTPAIVVPNGLDRAQLSEETTVAPPARKAIVFGHLGRVAIWHKGLDILLDGFEQVASTYPDIRLEITGRGGHDAEVLQRQIETRKLGAQVHYRGAVSGTPIEIIGNWDCLIVSARYDGFPQTALEAMAAQRPVLCTKEAGVTDYLREANAGVIVDATPLGIESGIRWIVDHEDETRAMGTSGRTYLLDNLTWDRIAEQAIRIYEGVATGAHLN